MSRVALWGALGTGVELDLMSFVWGEIWRPLGWAVLVQVLQKYKLGYFLGMTSFGLKFWAQGSL